MCLLWFDLFVRCTQSSDENVSSSNERARSNNQEMSCYGNIENSFFKSKSIYTLCSSLVCCINNKEAQSINYYSHSKLGLVIFTVHQINQIENRLTK